MDLCIEVWPTPQLPAQLRLARFCRDRRVVNRPGWMAGPDASGDFKPEELAEYQPTIQQRRNRLVSRLNEMERV